uniref:Uncharacterized protein n=1 Tax=Rhizophora mucronata TaxID=61149 RepID=A0A2P2Q4P4_RHIMU
MIYISICMYV